MRKRAEEEGRFMPRMSPALYADEEGRATMTRDVGDLGPFVLNRKKPIRHEKGCRGARRRTRGGEESLLWLVLGTSVSSSGTSFQPRLCTTHPYINMSSSCRNRADRGEPSSPTLLPALRVVLESLASIVVASSSEDVGRDAPL